MDGWKISSAELQNEKQTQKDAENAATMARLKLANEPRPGDPTGKPQGMAADMYLSDKDVKARASTFLDQLISENRPSNRTIVIVAHGMLNKVPRTPATPFVVFTR